jgi:hypothetical protein
MRYFRARMRGRRFMLVVATVALVVLGGAVAVASGAYPTSGVTVYTGCLTTSGGQNQSTVGAISSVAASPTTPTKPCASNQALIHLSGGTITSVTAGTGLTGGGSNGAIGVSLASGFKLPQGCTVSQIATSDGSGNWTCGDDQDTTYNGTNFALSGQGCPAHQFVTGIDASGNLKCAQPSVGDLNGSPCTVGDETTALAVSTDAATGAVSLQCEPVPVYSLDALDCTKGGGTFTVLNAPPITAVPNESVPLWRCDSTQPFTANTNTNLSGDCNTDHDIVGATNFSFPSFDYQQSLACIAIF